MRKDDIIFHVCLEYIAQLLGAFACRNEGFSYTLNVVKQKNKNQKTGSRQWWSTVDSITGRKNRNSSVSAVFDPCEINAGAHIRGGGEGVFHPPKFTISCKKSVPKNL